MQLSRSYKPHNAVDYFPLPNGMVDVFLHRNEVTETEIDEAGRETTVYVAEEVYFQADQTISKESIESNFESMWNSAENPAIEPTANERIALLEEALLMLLME